MSRKPGARRQVTVIPAAVPDVPGQLVVLDAQAYSLLAERDDHPGKRKVMTAIKLASQHGYAAAISVVTLAEQRRTGDAAQRLACISINEQIADHAGGLLESTGLDGHENVIDAIVVACAAGAAGPVLVVSSDRTHIPKLCAAASADRQLPVTYKPV